jgi:serine/threonine protein kinase
MDHSVLIFINNDATDVGNLFLNEDWTLTEIFERIYGIQVKGKPIDWIVKVHNDEKYARREILTLNKLKKVKNIPKILAAGLSTTLNYMIITKAPGYDLFDYINKKHILTEIESKNIIKKLLRILRDIHRNEVIHKDIKPENIIYDEKTDTLTLIDFEGKQTEDYLSPEQSRNQKITNKTDIWSTGITCYYLLAGTVPFSSTRDMLRKDVPLSRSWSPELKDFLKCVLEKDVKYRYDVINALNHVWITS